MLEQDLEGRAGAWEWGRPRGALARQSTQGLVSGQAGSSGAQDVEEGVAREQLEKDIAEGFGRPSLAFGPCLLSKRPGGFKAGSGMAEATILLAFRFLPDPWPVTAGFLPELSRSET